VCVSRHKKDSFMKKMIGTISIVVVLGITWTIGYLMLISHEETNLVFSYLFCILNATQVRYFAILRLIIEIKKKKYVRFICTIACYSLETCWKAVSGIQNFCSERDASLLVCHSKLFPLCKSMWNFISTSPLKRPSCLSGFSCIKQYIKLYSE